MPTSPFNRGRLSSRVRRERRPLRSPPARTRSYAASRRQVWWFFFFNDTATTEIYTLSLHDALPISGGTRGPGWLHLNPQVWNGYDDFVYDTQDACINDATARICNTKEILGDIELQKTDIASCEYRADYFIFVAIKTHNYEGDRKSTR